MNQPRPTEKPLQLISFIVTNQTQKRTRDRQAAIQQTRDGRHDLHQPVENRSSSERQSHSKAPQMLSDPISCGNPHHPAGLLTGFFVENCSRWCAGTRFWGKPEGQAVIIATTSRVLVDKSADLRRARASCTTA